MHILSLIPDKLGPVNRKQKFFLYLFCFFVAYWLILFASGSKYGFFNNLFGLLYSVMAVAAGVIALFYSRNSNYEKHILRGLFWVGLGLFCWGIGGVIWSYYSIIQGIILPYPSLADIFYLPSVFFYSIGVVYFTQSTNYFKNFQNNKNKLGIFARIIFTSVFTFYILTTILRGGILYDPQDSFLVNFLNIAYPCIDFVGLAVAVFVSDLFIKDLKTKQGLQIFVLALGLLMMFISDSMLSFYIIHHYYYDGDVTDLLYVISISIMSFSTLAFCA